MSLKKTEEKFNLSIQTVFQKIKYHYFKTVNQIHLQKVIKRF